MSMDPFGVRREITTPEGTAACYSLAALEKRTGANLSRMPFTMRILLESVLRQIDGRRIREEDIEPLLHWDDPSRRREIPFRPARVLMQDFTGVPAVVDLAVMRDALAEMGGDPARIDPLVPVDLVIDHSVQIDRYATRRAPAVNAEKEFERNRERYEFLRWGSEAFDNLRVVPPATGICHQVNLESLAEVVRSQAVDGGTLLFPDTLVGTDSHTTMIDAIGVLGWGVGGIEAEAALLGQPLYMLVPDVIGLELTGELPDGVTATDLVLTVTQMLRGYGVVGKIVEIFGPGLGALRVADRATISNMSPEYGATAGFFPVDDRTLAFLAETGRDPGLVARVEAYTREQGLFRTDDAPRPEYTDTLKLDLGTVVPSVAGHNRPQDRIALPDLEASVGRLMDDLEGGEVADGTVAIEMDGAPLRLGHGSVVISAITSCTNTSNPSVMVAAGLLARKAVQLGLRMPAHVKTSLAPGSRVVTAYLEAAGLVPYLEALGYHLVGYGCTTCIGNSGPLRDEIVAAIREHGLIAAAVLSGNRNFEGRIHPDVRASYLASPPLVIAYGLAGTMAIDLSCDPIGRDRNGEPITLRDIWPGREEIDRVVGESVRPEQFRTEYGDVYTGNETWNRVKVTSEPRYPWGDLSTYIRKPTFFDGLTADVPPLEPIEGARVLALLGDSVTTDHISPAGAIPAESPAGRWLIERGVGPEAFNTFGSRRGNHEVMMRGTFGNIRIRNRLVPGVEGGVTMHLPSGRRMDIYDAAAEYAREGTPLVVLAGREYGTGSSRDWAAKGTAMLGVRAVIARGYERIHRSNLIGMGVLPLEFTEGEGVESLGLTGTEVYSIEALTEPGQEITVTAREVAGGGQGAGSGGRETRFRVRARIDTPVELEYLRNGGILHTVLRELARNAAG